MRKVKKNSTSEGFKFGAGVVIGIIAIIFLFFLFFDLGVNVELQGVDGDPIALKPTIQPNAPSQQNAPNLPSVSIEPEDNRAQCPAGNRADSGQKTDDWFGCKDVEAILNLEKDYEKIDCSNRNNFNLSILDFEITRYCEADVGGEDRELYGNFEDGLCEDVYEGVIKPSVKYEAFPSLSEYKFYNVGVSIDNNGCTKERLSDYSIFYGLYQNNQPIAFNFVNLGQDYFGDQILDPQAGNDYYVTNVGFGKGSYLTTPVVRTTPDDYTLKMCLSDSSTPITVSCDWADFDMRYKA